ncbi:HAMP domain-containing sensor histidine kinase [uncultured Tyzzerella sp.]|uniref:sensor histidine kinase n=1 Tax=uncultured Tyzzerella sp. TaxID=2321398 RepID=UPI0029434DD2|nr:HAMP domain-containing sensor histidine kinase [uncultured Tyzzerella sp.]
MKNTMESYFRNIDERELLYQANKIAVMIQEGNYLSSPEKQKELLAILEEKSSDEDFRILIIDDNGVVISDTNASSVDKTFIIPEVILSLNGKNNSTYHKEEKTLYASSYIEEASSYKKGVVLLISSFENSEMLIAGVSQKWFLLTIFISIIIGIFVFFTSEIVISPLKKILKSINEITDGQLHQRVKINGSNEISQLGEAFNAMTEKLEQIDTSRQEFVSNVSHELKTPLSSIKVLSDSILLQEDIPSEVYIEFLQDINSEIDRMTEIVNNLLALVKLDFREAGLNITETDLNKMLDDILKRLTPLSAQKNITISKEYLKNVVVEADEMKFSLAISNLVENAIKYTNTEGSVKVTLDCDHQNAFITVSDTGIGINEEEQTKIFNRFYRVDKTRDRETGGTGLGLSITHSTVILHKGSIKVSSKEGEGSTFIVRIPIKFIEKQE